MFFPIWLVPEFLSISSHVFNLPMMYYGIPVTLVNFSSY